MVDVFISYKQEERERMRPIADGLRALGVDVWFDERLQPGGSFTEEIEGLIATCKAQIVCWSPAAVKSEWVLGEADKGRRRGVLISTIIQPCDLPTPFNMLHSEDLSEWRGDQEAHAWRKVVDAVGRKIGRPDLAADVPAQGRPTPEASPRKTPARIGKFALALGAVALAAAAIVIVPRLLPQGSVAGAESEEVVTDARAALAVIDRISAHEWSTMPGDELAARVIDESSIAALSSAAERDARAQALLGLAYLNGFDVEQNDAEAVRLFTLSANQDFVRGQIGLASMYRECLGVSCNDAETMRLYRLAAQRGNAIAQFVLGELYMEGRIVAVDEAEALRQFSLSANQGYGPAEFALGVMHEAGRGGLAPDRAEAVRLYRRAASRGESLAEQQLFRLGER